MLAPLIVLTAAVAGGAESDAPAGMLLEWDGQTVPVVSYATIDGSCSELLSNESLPSDPRGEILLRQADATYYLRLYDKSAGAAEKAVPLRPDDWTASWRLARALLNVPGRQNEAARIGNQLVAEQPARGEGYYVLGCLRLMSGQFSECVELLDKAVQRAPRNPQFLYIRANAHFLRDDVERCLRDLDVALTLPPVSTATRSELHALYGRALFATGRFEEAAPFLVASLRLPRKAEETIPRLWYCLGQERRFGGCLVLTTAMVSKYPQLRPAHWMHARTLAQVGDLNEAARVARRAVEAGPNDPEAWASLVAVCLEQGDFAGALQAFNRGARGSIDASLRASFILATCPDDRIRDGRTAKTGAKKCLDCLASTDARQIAMLVVAVAEAECGETEAAQKTVSAALELGTPRDEVRIAFRELTALFQAGKAYRYDPRIPGPVAFRLHPAMVFVH